jgi:hypothetical protein
VAACLQGCSTAQIAQYETKVGAKRCAIDQGITPGSPQLEQCIANYKAGWEQEKAINRAGVATAIGVGIALRQAKEQGQARGVLGIASTNSQEILLVQLPARNYVATRLDSDLYQLDRSHTVQTRYCHTFANYTPATVVGNAISFKGHSGSCTIIKAWQKSI